MTAVTKTNHAKEAVLSLGCPVVITAAPHRIARYLGIEFPFLTHYPEKPLLFMLRRDGTETLIVPWEVSGAVRAQGYEGRLLTYSSAEAESEKRAAELAAGDAGETAEVGLDRAFLTAAMEVSLRNAMPGVNWISVDGDLEKIDWIKYDHERAYLEEAARQLDFGIIASLQHLEGSLRDIGYTAAEFCERIRVHVYECGGTAGGLAFSGSGRSTWQWYGLPAGYFKPGEFVRIESTSCYKGFWANSARMIFLGEPDDIHKRAYQENLFLKEQGLALLEPGRSCDSIYRDICAAAQREGIDVCSDYAAGHGIGTAERESPYICEGDETKLQEGMSIVLSLYSQGPAKELICSKDTYMITRDGPRCISRYHNWDRIYPVTGFRSSH